ncbi:MAG TPA: hypothetical protein VK559_00010 [Ferruginibacter sp.]|nr:hypothetical protein [Ferruginibacter sp.]
MTKHLLKTICFLLISTIAFAQKETKAQRKYEDRSMEVQDEVWNRKDSAFDVTTVPAKYKDESAVIIAKSAYKTADESFAMNSYYTTIRERVLIKDKVSLDEYSSLGFKKGEETLIDIYVGAKITKPDGKVIIVNSLAEEVLTENNKKQREGKIAIPNLQVGDIIDYYFRYESHTSGGKEGAQIQGPDIYYLADTHPVLYYNVLYDLDKAASADILSINGAKNLHASRDENSKHLIITFTERDLPKVSTTLWTSPAREIPYYVIRYSFDGAYGDMISKDRTESTGPFTDIEKNKLKIACYTIARTCDHTPYINMLAFFGGKRTVKELPVDSIANYFYNYYRWAQYGTFTDMNVSNQRNQLGMDAYTAAVSFTEMLKLCDLNCDLVLTADRYSNRLKDVFSEGDFNILVKVSESGKLKWFSFNDFFQDGGQILSNFQGENALLLTREGGKFAKFKDTEEPLVLPVAKSSENVSAEDIKVTLNKDNLQLTTIDRTCKETGAMKHSDQQNLLLPEDVEANLAATIGADPTTVVLSRNKATRAQAKEAQTALDKERPKQKDYFKQEIKDQYDQDPVDLISYKINNTGLSIYNPVFDYNEVFTMDNFVKKAGNNFIFEVGRLMGSYTGAAKKDSERTVDVYMLCARTLTYNFSVAIPDGYTAQGIDVLNKKVGNDIASFESSAKLTGNTLTITVTRIYNNNFEPASNWPKLATVMNAAADFTAQKILLEKK